jgi:hypothetical protein
MDPIASPGIPSLE